MFRIYESVSRADINSQIEGQLIESCAGLLHQFIHEVPHSPKNTDRDSWIPGVLLVLREIIHMPDARFCKHAKVSLLHIPDVVLLFVSVSSLF